MEYLSDVIKKNEYKIRNIRAFVLTAAYNAPSGIDAHYSAIVSYDMRRKLNVINEEIARKTLSLEVKAVKVTGKLLLNLLKKLIKEAEKLGGLEKLVKVNGNEVKLKDMAKKGQLEEIPVEEAELKELKKELNKYGVKFSVMKDKETGKYSVFFQAKDMKMMEKSFKNALATSERKAERKESIHKNIEKFKEMAKNTVSKEKIKNKQKEQSL